MQKPDLTRVWETYIDIDKRYHISVLRLRVAPMIRSMLAKGQIGWYCFLLHSSREPNDQKCYYHIRFENLTEANEKTQINEMLPDYCSKQLTSRFLDVEEFPDEISGIDKSTLVDSDISLAWKLIGEQSEWILNLIEIHQSEKEITTSQIMQFLHFFANIVQMQIT